MAKTRSKQSSKNDFPLWLHTPTGQWAKKVKQRVYYFGTDRHEAAKRWNAEKDAIYAGEVRPRESGNASPTVVELANVFHSAQREKYAITGKPGLRHIELCEITLRRFLEIVGPKTRVEDLGPRDFEKIKLELFKPVKRKERNGAIIGRVVQKRSPETVAGDVRRIKIFLNWCYEQKYTGKPDYGKSFPVETQVAVTKESLRKSRKKDLTSTEIEAVVEQAGVNFKPLIYLAINAGLGAGDISAIDFDDLRDLDQKECWVDLPRLKTGTERRFLLWPETQKAIREYLKIRRAPIRSHQHLVFLTSHGLPWMRGEGHHHHIDSAGSTFTKLRKAAGVARGSFYDLRRTFATIACETLDFDAVRQCMGHVEDRRSMLSKYVQGVSDERIRKVCDHVRKWYRGGK